MTRFEDEILMNKAKQIGRIPEHYQLVVADNYPKENGRYRSYIWEDPNDPDRSIEVVFELESGELHRLKVDVKKDRQTKFGLEEAELKKITENFILTYAPELAKEQTWCEIDYLRDDCACVEYQLTAGGLPLPQTGCRLLVENGEVTLYQKYQPVKKPDFPKERKQPEEILEDIKQRQKMKLVFALDFYSFQGIEEPKYKLVYEPMPQIRFVDASTGKDSYDESHYTLPPDSPVPCVENPSAGSQPAVEELLNIDLEKYEKVYEAETDDVIKMVWDLKNKEAERSDPFTFDRYFRERIPNLKYLKTGIMIMVEKSSHSLIQLMRSSYCHDGTLSFSMEECLEKALKFLAAVFPGYHQYLRLWEKDGEPTEEDPYARFHFSVYVNNIPVSSQMVHVVVNAKTGDITSYSGISPSLIKQMKSISPVPVLSHEKAMELYLKHLRVELRWFASHEEEDTLTYKLIYVPTTEQKDPVTRQKKEIRFIDAITGEFIWG